MKKFYQKFLLYDYDFFYIFDYNGRDSVVNLTFRARVGLDSNLAVFKLN